jgi:hypothetical protein
MHLKAIRIDMPHHQWVLQQVKISDGHTGDGADTLLNSFE